MHCQICSINFNNVDLELKFHKRLNNPIQICPIPSGHAYAKALHYRELEFQTSPATCFESLININKKLDQYDAAIGVLKVVGEMQKKHPELVRHSSLIIH